MSLNRFFCLAMCTTLSSAALMLPSEASAKGSRDSTEPYCTKVTCSGGACTACGDFAMSWCDPDSGSPICIASDRQT